jgi:hypothetical protein
MSSCGSVTKSESMWTFFMLTNNTEDFTTADIQNQTEAESAKANGRELKSLFCQVFNFKLGYFCNDCK